MTAGAPWPFRPLDLPRFPFEDDPREELDFLELFDEELLTDPRDELRELLLLLSDFFSRPDFSVLGAVIVGCHSRVEIKAFVTKLAESLHVVNTCPIRRVRSLLLKFARAFALGRAGRS